MKKRIVICSTCGILGSKFRSEFSLDLSEDPKSALIHLFIFGLTDDLTLCKGFYAFQYYVKTFCIILIYPELVELRKEHDIKEFSSHENILRTSPEDPILSWN